MWSINPAVYLKHAWEKTNSVWGKIALVLFYTFLWLGILKAIWGLIDPTFLGRFSCFSKATGFDETLELALTRGICLFVLAFFIYADKGGLHSWNVGFVAFFMLMWIWIVKATMINQMKASMYEECIGWMGVSMWIGPIWIVLALLLVIVDERKGDGGTEGERQALTV